MLLTLFKYKLLLLVVLFSTPVFSQIYGTTESTNDCPDCCKTPPKPPVCIETGSMPQCKYNVDAPKPICVDEQLRVLDIMEQRKLIEEKKVKLEENINTLNGILGEARLLYNQLLNERATIVASIAGVVARFANKQAEECLTNNHFWFWNQRETCPKLCGDSNGGRKIINYGKYVKDAVGSLNGCLKAGLALYDAYHDPKAGNLVNATVEAIAAKYKVADILKAQCKMVGYDCNGDQVKCTIELPKAACKVGLKELTANVKWLEPKIFIKTIACVKIDPISIGVDLAFVAGTLAYDANSCPAPKTWMSIMDWYSQAQNAVRSYDDSVSAFFADIKKIEGDMNAENRKISELNEQLTQLFKDLQNAAGQLITCKAEEHAKADKDDPIPYSRCGG